MFARGKEISEIPRLIVWTSFFAATGLSVLSACDGEKEREEWCGAAVPASLEGPWWDSDQDGISTYVELEPLNDRYCLDTLQVNADPSEVVGKAYDGRLLGGLNLPEGSPLLPYYHQPGTDDPDSDDWGSLELVNTIELTARCWSDYLRKMNRSGPRIGILDLSLRQGGPFPPHVSHEAGVDVDVRYVRRDGRDERLNLATADSMNHDLAGSLELMFCFWQSGEIDRIFVDTSLEYRFEDWTGGSIVGTNGHYHHFHVRIAPPTVADERTGNGSPTGAGRSKATASAEETASPVTRAESELTAADDGRPPAAATAQMRRTSTSAALATQVARTTEQDTAPAPRFLARVRPRDAISILNISPTQDVEERVIYDLQGKLLSDVRIDPAERYVSFIEKATALERSDLVVLAASGLEVHRDTASVQRYTWLGRANKIAQIQGSPEEGGVGFKPTGAYVFDLDTKQKIELSTPAPAYKVEWAAFDSAVYFATLHPVNGSRVFRYDPRSGRVSPTGHHDILFSPAGKFYLHHPDEVVAEHLVYDSQTDGVVPVPDTLGVPQRWVYDEGSYLLLAKIGRRPTGEMSPSGIRLTTPVVQEHLVYDVASGRVVSRTEGAIPNVIAPRGELPVLEQGQVKLLRRGVRKLDLLLRR